MGTSLEATPVAASVEGGAKSTGRKRSTRPLLYTRMKPGASRMTSSPPPAPMSDMALERSESCVAQGVTELEDPLTLWF